ncbi:MAG TPA: YaiI/YqxD family protein [Planctomycetaceae bacterium]|nr:YaiI/YqxD family protein [Planctomycetaceae bacterium]HQZ65298.1 YaiI/YqxD family protein [Planctomycetaceae bacterium]
MQIWVDADACPVEAKEVLYKVSKRLKIQIILVANQMMWIPSSSLIRLELVGAGADVADRRIVELLSKGDLVISADIPLAANAVARGATVLDPRGEELNADNVGARLAARNLMDELRGSGMQTGGPAAYSAKNKQDFANQLDRLITKLNR